MTEECKSESNKGTLKTINMVRATEECPKEVVMNYSASNIGTLNALREPPKNEKSLKGKHIKEFVE